MRKPSTVEVRFGLVAASIAQRESPAMLSFRLHRACIVLAASAPLVGVSTSAGAQIPEVSAICADRPPATGASLFAAAEPGPIRSGSSADRPASDLYCIDLFSTARAAEAAGVVEIRRP
jgi:hypothetical protein